MDKLCFLFCRLILLFGMLFSPGGRVCFTWNLQFSTLPDVFLVSISLFPFFLSFSVPFVLLFDRKGAVFGILSLFLLCCFTWNTIIFSLSRLSYFISMLVLSSFSFLFGYLPRKLFAFVPFPRCFPFSLLDSFRFFSLNLSFRRVGDTVIPISRFIFPLFVFFVLIFRFFSDSCSVGRLLFHVFPYLFPYYLSKRLDFLFFFSFCSVFFVFFLRFIP